MRAILHIGLPRTGTTAIQTWLAREATALEEVGIVPVPTLACHRLAVESLRDRAQGRPDVVAIRQQQTFAEAVELAIQPSPATKMISSEYFFVATPADVARGFAAAGIHVDMIICFLRRQDDLCASSYCQNVLSIGVSQAVRGMGYDPLLDWGVLHAHWQEAFPAATLEFADYDGCARAGLIRSLKRILKVEDMGGNEPDDRLNSSVSAEIAEVARMLNERQRTFAIEGLVAQSSPQAEPFGFHQNVVDQFEGAFIDSNRAVARLLPGRFEGYAEKGWLSRGIDLTDQVSERRMLELYERSQAVLAAP